MVRKTRKANKLLYYTRDDPYNKGGAPPPCHSLLSEEELRHQYLPVKQKPLWAVIR